jgi:hypothetical protein
MISKGKLLDRVGGRWYSVVTKHSFFLPGCCFTEQDFIGEAINGRRWWLEALGGLVIILMVRERKWRAGSYLLEGRES